jgi:hypothetical protein
MMPEHTKKAAWQGTWEDHNSTAALQQACKGEEKFTELKKGRKQSVLRVSRICASKQKQNKNVLILYINYQSSDIFINIAQIAHRHA